MSKLLRPGQPAPKSGIYDMLGPARRSDGRTGRLDAGQTATADAEARPGLSNWQNRRIINHLTKNEARRGMPLRGLFIGIDQHASTLINELSCAKRDAVALDALFTELPEGLERTCHRSGRTGASFPAVL